MRVTCLVLGLAVGWISPGAVSQEAKPPVPAPEAKWPFEFAKETTYVLKPFRKDGTIDYVGAINERLSQGVTKENNAAIGLLDAIGPGTGRMREHYARVRAKLGVPAEAAPAADADHPGGDVVAGAPPQWENMTGRAWIEQDAPEVARWLGEMAPRLDKVVEASKRDRFYMPLIRPREDDSMVSILLPHLNEARQLCNMLKARAMLCLGKEDGAGFRRDAVAVVRLGRLLATAPTMIEKLVGIGCEAMGLEALKFAVTGGWLSDAQAQAIVADLRAAPKAAPVHESFEMTERGFLLEFLQFAAVHGVAEAEKMLRQMAPQVGRNNGMPGLGLNVPGKDWNAALRKANGWFDRLIEAGKKATYAERKRATQEFERALAALKEEQSGIKAAMVPLEDRAIVLLMPSVVRAYETETRMEANRRLTEVAVALSAFRTSTGEYPEELKQLVPTYLKDVPADPFTGEALVYVRDGQGYLLQSMGSGLVGGRGRGNELVVKVQK